MRRALLAASLLVASTAMLAATPAAAKPIVQSGPSAAAASANRLVASGDPRLHKSRHDALNLVKVHQGTNGLQYAAFERTHRGLPVIGGDAVIVTDRDGVVLHTAAAQDKTIELAITPTIPKPANATLAVYALGEPKLVWHKVTDNHLHTLVDAHTGKVVKSYDEVVAGTGSSYYNGNVSIGTSGSGTSFTMTDPARPGLSCGGLDGNTYTGVDNTWGNGTGTDLETACVDALYAGAKEWDMLSAWLGRNGFDGEGHGFPARVGGDYTNAYWYGAYAEFGRSSDLLRQAVSVDLVGHEFGHGIFANTPGGSFAENGLNEGTADIFGTLTEHYTNDPNHPSDYVMFEDFNYYGGGAVRYQYDPSQLGDPNCWSTAIRDTAVHPAAGPLNHWFYLMAEGSNPSNGHPASPICTGGPASVTGIGLVNAGKVYYNALLTKTSGWEYVDVRVATLAAAKNLYPGDCTNFNRVRDAWNAVSVPAGAQEPQCGTTDDFALSIAPHKTTVRPGQSMYGWVSTTRIAGSTELLTLSASGLPTGTTAKFEPATLPTGDTTQVTITTSESTPTGTFPITITGVGMQTRTTTLDFRVNAVGADDFGLELNNVPEFIVPGNSADVTVKAAIYDGSSPQQVTLSAVGLPAGATATFIPQEITAGGIIPTPSTMHITTAPSTPYGEYRVVIVGDGTVATHHTWFILKVTPVPNDFTVAISPQSASVPSGGSVTLTINTTLVSGAVPEIRLSSTKDGVPLGTGFTWSDDNLAAGESATITLAIPADATPGDYTFTVIGTSPEKEHRAAIPLTVTQGSLCGGREVTYTGTVSSGASVYKPGTSGFYSIAGLHQGCLDGPTGKDFDLYLQRWNGSSWVNVANGSSSGPDETLSYNGTAGYYRYRVYAYSGSGAYTLGYNVP